MIGLTIKVMTFLCDVNLVFLCVFITFTNYMCQLTVVLALTKSHNRTNGRGAQNKALSDF